MFSEATAKSRHIKKPRVKVLFETLSAGVTYFISYFFMCVNANNRLASLVAVADWLAVIVLSVI